MSNQSQPREPRPVTTFERIRRARGLKQIDVATAAEVSRSYIAMCEHGWRPPLHRQDAIAAALNVDTDLLWPNPEE